MSDKITFILIIWIVLLFAITSNVPIEIYYVLIFLSLIIIAEFVNTIISNKLKKRINVLIFVFLVVYSYLVIKKIMITFYPG
jgi:hypothetical protein